MADTEFREARPEDADALLQVRNKIFPPLSKEAWLASGMTAAVAIRNGEMVGAIPLDIREFQIRPGVILNAAFENAVGTREDLRGQGIGTGMLDAAKKFLPGRADVLMVYRGAETSIGYNFYAKNRHYDMSYVRPLTLSGECRLQGSSRAEVTEIEEALRRPEEMNEVFQSAYGRMGGFPPRHPGFWRKALGHALFEVLPHQFKLIVREEKGRLAGYLIVGHKSTRGAKSIVILEMATRGGDKDLARELLLTFRKYVDPFAEPKTAAKQDRSLYSQVLREAGFVPTPREKTSMMVMAYPLDPESMARKAWAPNPKLDDMEVVAWSPLRKAVLHRAQGQPRKTVLLEMKDDTLTRLLLSRLDVLRAVEEERITVLGATEDDLIELARCLPFAPWEYHQIEYL